MKRESKKMARVRAHRTYFRVAAAAHALVKAGTPGPGSPEWERVRDELVKAGLIDPQPDGSDKVNEKWSHRRVLPSSASSREGGETK